MYIWQGPHTVVDWIAILRLSSRGLPEVYQSFFFFFFSYFYFYYVVIISFFLRWLCCEHRFGLLAIGAKNYFRYQYLVSVIPELS